MTQQERNELATRLGITPEKYPHLWKCGWCKTILGNGRHGRFCNCLAPHMEGHKEFTILPDPDSDDPTACLWEPFLMRALPNGFYLRQATWAGEVAPNEWVVLGPSWFYEDAQEVIGTGATPTAALYAAWLARDKV